MKKINYYILALVALVGSVFTSCKDDETNLSRAVLASASILEYETLPTESQSIIVTSDADWYMEAPEWITVSPASGHAGQTVVEISVSDNLRDGTPDNPRKAQVLFKGRNLESIAIVRISQSGDIFRDPVNYTITDMENAPDETILQLPELTVMQAASDGFIATDGTKEVYVLYYDEEETRAEAVRVKNGQTVTVHGEKLTDDMSFPYVLGLRLKDITDGETIAYPDAIDITEDVDNLKGKDRAYVSVTGTMENVGVLTIEGKNNKVYLSDNAAELNIPDLVGHNLKVTGYYAGTASPVVRIIPTEIEDYGLNMITLFFEDFEWIAPYAIAGKDGNTPAGDTVGTNGATSEAPKADAAKVNGKTCTEALMEKGYNFVSAHNYNNDKDARDFALYLQQNYLKFNKTGNVGGKPYQEGLVLPALDNVPAGVKLMISFDWCPQMQGTGLYDKTEMAVIVVNGDDEEEVVAPGHNRPDGSDYSWQSAVLDLSDVKVDKNTKLIIRNSNAAWGDKTAHRFYLDNIRIYYIP